VGVVDPDPVGTRTHLTAVRRRPVGDHVTSAKPHDSQTRQDIRRAESLMSLARGITRSESTANLKYDAAVSGVSVHAAALAFLSPDLPVATVPSPTARRRHLFAVPSGSDVAGSTGQMQSAG
jgi:hypothetical protein